MEVWGAVGGGAAEEGVAVEAAGGGRRPRSVGQMVVDFELVVRMQDH